MLDINDICLVDNVFGVCLKTERGQAICVYLAKQDYNDILQRVTNSFCKPMNYQNQIQMLETTVEMPETGKAQANNGETQQIVDRQAKTADNIAKSKGVLGIFNAFKRGE